MTQHCYNGVIDLTARYRRRLHHFAERYFPEQRLYLRTGSSTRYLRLTPSRQIILAVSTVALFGWTLFASAHLVVGAITASDAKTQASLSQQDYEDRLNTISAERDKRALEAQTAQERFYIALEQISLQQSALLESEDRRKELETGIEVIQRTLRKSMKERDLARRQSDKLLAELQSVTGSTSTAAGHQAEIEVTLDYLNRALERTVSERDEMESATAEMEITVADLKHQARLTDERNERIFSRLEEAVTVSISPLEKLFEDVGLSTDKLLDDVKRGYSGTGGPLTPIAVSTRGEPEDPTSLKANEILSDMDKVNLMRIAAERVPFAKPVRANYRLTSSYGWRRHPVTGRSSLHEGTDMAAGIGTPIYAPAEGVVTFAGWAGGYGRLIKIRHAMGFETRYAHLSAIKVKKGQRVSLGDRIGDMGSSGRSTGSHLHYEIRIGGKSVNAMKFIKAARNVF